MTEQTTTPDPRDQWTADGPWWYSHTTQGYALTRHSRRDGHVHTTGYYLATEDSAHLYWMGPTFKQAAERYQIEFGDGWKNTNLSRPDGELLMRRGGEERPYSELVADLRRRVAASKRQAKRAALDGAR
jgi:hypothetical protein